MNYEARSALLKALPVRHRHEVGVFEHPSLLVSGVLITSDQSSTYTIGMPTEGTHPLRI